MTEENQIIEEEYEESIEEIEYIAPTSVGVIAKELFLPVEVLININERNFEGLKQMREGFACAILEIIKENLTDVAFLDALQNAVVKSEIAELLNHKLNNLSPRAIVQAPSFEEENHV
jgi:hypothetical protein